MARPGIILVFLLALCFTLATWLGPQQAKWSQREESGGVLKTILGDGRRMFANHFLTKADVYFHSGYYPSLFEQAQRAPIDARHMKEEHKEGQETPEEEAHEKAMDFLGKPRDWIDSFGRHFYPSTHSHLDKPGEVREILPWLRLSADLDPKKIDTYMVASFWLRKHLGKVDEAEQFLREGVRANPDSYEILFELGSLYNENRHDPVRARNLWELALRRWREQDTAGKKPDEILCDKILANLSHVEEEQGNLVKAMDYLEQELKYAPQPYAINKHIGELKEKMAGKTPNIQH
jgi:tetratricopeptide (TPR) repeat protein